jgi:hypothetical protein
MAEQATIEEPVTATTATATAVKETSNVAETSKASETTTEEGTLLGETPKVTAPDKYEVKLPEGQEIDTEFLGTLTPILQKHNISQEALQELAGVYAPYIQKMSEGIKQQELQAFKQMKADWLKQSNEILGTNAKTELSIAAKAIDKFGGAELRQILNESGLGNHPAFVQAFVKVGKAISEDTFVEPDYAG